jgi:hypothetical protein
MSNDLITEVVFTKIEDVAVENPWTGGYSCRTCGSTVLFGTVLAKAQVIPPGVTIYDKSIFLGQPGYSVVICEECVRMTGYKRTNSGWKKMSKAWQAKQK